ncbi:hypothetical protein OAD22_07315 [Pseudomonadales bacterium]|nr:hypothetical protein [Pseudomonadales bacterium]MDB9917557.1 hypothetical protein [Pseudomonadales bacterium]
MGTSLITVTRKSLVSLSAVFIGDLDSGKAFSSKAFGSKAFSSKAFSSKASVNFSPKRAEDPLALVAPSPTLIRAFFRLKFFRFDTAICKAGLIRPAQSDSCQRLKR